MLQYLVIPTLLGLCVLDYRGKISYDILIFFMFLMGAYAISTYDSANYLILYANVNNIRDILLMSTDIGFLVLIYFAKSLGLDFYGFQTLISVIGLLLLTYVFKKYSTAPAFGLALYFIFNYYSAITQLRAFISENFLYLLVIWVVKNEKLKLLPFFSLFFLALIFHSSSIFFLLLLLIYKIKKRKTIVLTVGIICFLLVFIHNFAEYIPYATLISRIQVYTAKQREELSTSALVFIALYLFITMYLLHLVKKEKYVIWKNELERLLRIHIIGMISCFLIVLFSSNFYRFARVIIVVDFIILGSYAFRSRKINYHNFAQVILFVMLFYILYEHLTGLWLYMINNNFIFSML